MLYEVITVLSVSPDTIREVSRISTMKVLSPREMSSDAPILVKIRSTTPISALSAGTKDRNNFV